MHSCLRQTAIRQIIWKSTTNVRKCNDTGYYQDHYCNCLEQEIASSAIREMNRSAQLALATFDQFSLEYYRGRTSQNGEDCYAMMRRILSACQSYAAGFTEKSPSLLFYGGTGLGKNTSVACHCP